MGAPSCRGSPFLKTVTDDADDAYDQVRCHSATMAFTTGWSAIPFHILVLRSPLSNKGIPWNSCLHLAEGGRAMSCLAASCLVSPGNAFCMLLYAVVFLDSDALEPSGTSGPMKRDKHGMTWNAGVLRHISWLLLLKKEATTWAMLGTQIISY